ncbi:MAG TPA: helix-turn-helix domain-containing protein, partial [Acidimicrobiia bacterium]|nr:helix-turn-helix domain-containing protein [Acidimicrobiia bacterium]
VPEVARRLDMDGLDVYTLILEGELNAAKRDGLVYVPEEAVRDYERRRPTRQRRAKKSPPPPNSPREDREWLLSVPEVARRLGMEGTAVYDLILTKELDAGKGRDGLVYVPEEALRDFEERRKTEASQ